MDSPHAIVTRLLSQTDLTSAHDLQTLEIEQSLSYIRSIYGSAVPAPAWHKPLREIEHCLSVILLARQGMAKLPPPVAVSPPVVPNQGWAPRTRLMPTR